MLKQILIRQILLQIKILLENGIFKEDVIFSTIFYNNYFYIYFIKTKIK